MNSIAQVNQITQIAQIAPVTPRSTTPSPALAVNLSALRTSTAAASRFADLLAASSQTPAPARSDVGATAAASAVPPAPAATATPPSPMDDAAARDTAETAPAEARAAATDGAADTPTAAPSGAATPANRQRRTPGSTHADAAAAGAAAQVAAGPAPTATATAAPADAAAAAAANAANADHAQGRASAAQASRQGYAADAQTLAGTTATAGSALNPAVDLSASMAGHAAAGAGIDAAANAVAADALAAEAAAGAASGAVAVAGRSATTVGDIGALGGAAAAAGSRPGSLASASGATSSERNVTIATPTDAADFRDILGAQVGVLVKDGVHTAELHLNPADMGPISVQIAMDGTQANVHFGTDSAETRRLLETGLPELAAALSEAGFTLAGGGVSEHAGNRGGADDPTAGNGDRSTAGARRIGAAGTGGDGAPLARLATTAPLRTRGALDLYA